MFGLSSFFIIKKFKKLKIKKFASCNSLQAADGFVLWQLFQ